MSLGLELNDPTPPPSLNGLEKADRIQVMVDWFFQNFEDPAHETPYESREGGYQYIWGGPYDASEQLHHFFGESSEEEIIEAVEEIETGGYVDWAPSGSRIRPDDLDEDPPTPLAQRVAALRGELAAIEDALKRLPNQQPMMGHNRPPEEYRDYIDQEEIKDALARITELQIELEKPNPVDEANVEVVERAEGVLRKIARKLISVVRWAGNKIIDGVLTEAGKELFANPAALALKIEHVASTLGAWVHHLNPLF